MEYEFGGLCGDQLDKLEKRLESLKKSFIKEYVLSLHVINNTNVNDKMSEIKISLGDLFSDEIKRSTICWTESMNKAQRLLASYLKE